MLPYSLNLKYDQDTKKIYKIIDPINSEIERRIERTASIIESTKWKIGDSLEEDKRKKEYNKKRKEIYKNKFEERKKRFEDKLNKITNENEIFWNKIYQKIGNNFYKNKICDICSYDRNKFIKTKCCNKSICLNCISIECNYKKSFTCMFCRQILIDYEEYENIISQFEILSDNSFGDFDESFDSIDL